MIALTTSVNRHNVIRRRVTFATFLLTSRGAVNTVLYFSMQYARILQLFHGMVTRTADGVGDVLGPRRPLRRRGAVKCLVSTLRLKQQEKLHNFIARVFKMSLSVLTQHMHAQISSLTHLICNSPVVLSVALGGCV